MTPGQAAERLAQAETAAKADPTPETFAAFMQAQSDLRHAEDQAARTATPHVRKPPKKQPPRMSGPRYFNLMRAIESDPVTYADYLPTTYCGAPRTTQDWDRRAATAKNATAVAEAGVCPACLSLANPPNSDHPTGDHR